MKIILDNAQTGGPKIRVQKNDETVGVIYPRGDEPGEMTYWHFPEWGCEPYESLADVPECDGIVLYSDEPLSVDDTTLADLAGC
jgi:hypothetical protein